MPRASRGTDRRPVTDHPMPASPTRHLVRVQTGGIHHANGNTNGLHGSSPAGSDTRLNTNQRSGRRFLLETECTTKGEIREGEADAEEELSEEDLAEKRVNPKSVDARFYGFSPYATERSARCPCSIRAA